MIVALKELAKVHVREGVNKRPRLQNKWTVAKCRAWRQGIFRFSELKASLPVPIK